MALIDEARRRGLFDPAPVAPMQYSPGLAARVMGSRPGYRSGGLIEGPGTGTSDSIPAEVPEGTYILPEDTTRAVGLSARASEAPVSVALSNGEFEVTPEQLQSIGAAVLDILRGVTHMPVEVEDEQAEGGQEEPGEDREGYANGGQVMPAYRMDAAADPRSTVYGSNNPYASSNAMRMSGLASSIGSRGVMELGRAPAPQPQTARNSFGDAAAATSDPMVTQLPMARRPGFADGGMVTDEERRQNMLSQIPTGGMNAPPADGSQNNPLNNEVGRNALNTLSALPGVGGLAARATAPAARAASGLPAAVERATPAAWEVVQDGGALASRTTGAANPTAGALTRAASLAPDVAAAGTPGRAAQMLSGPPGQIVQRTATELGDAIPMAGARARGATPWADVVDPLALGGAGAGQAGAATAQGASGLGRMGAAAGAGGLAAAAMLSGDSPAGVPSPTASTTAPTSPPPAAQPRSLAAEALMGPPMSASGSVTRDGNSYSGPANIAGNVTFRNPDGSLRQSGGTVTSLPAGAQLGGGQGLAAAALGGSLPGGGISAQSMGAADALAARSQAESMGRLLASGQIQAPQAGPSLILPGGTGFRRDSRFIAQELGAQRALDVATGNDPASRARQAALQQTAMKEQGDMSRALIGERGNNARAMIESQGRVTAAGIKAAQDAAKAQAAANKPLAGPVLKQLQETRDNAMTIGNLNSTFKPEFAGKGVLGFGADAQLSASGVLGKDKEAVDWWKNYRKQAELTERHALFGAALTPGEQDSWRSADIGPGMNPEVIQRNLATRAALAAKVFGNTRQDLIDAGHSPERINAIASREQQAAPSAEPTGGAAVALPPRDKLVSGTAYQTPRGMAVWDGKQFTLSN